MERKTKRSPEKNRKSGRGTCSEKIAKEKTGGGTTTALRNEKLEGGGSQTNPNQNEWLQIESGSAGRVLRATFSKSVNIIAREIQSISIASRRGKLDNTQSGELRSYAALLGNMVKQHQELRKIQKEKIEEQVSKMTEEDMDLEWERLKNEKAGA